MTLNQIGLILNITGTIILLYYGTPSKLIDDRGPSIVAEYDEKELTEIRKNNRMINIMSTIGIWVLLIGFCFQLAHEFL